MNRNSLKKEKCVLLTVLLFFELSYLFRFILDYKATKLILKDEYFKFFLWEDLAYIFEALSFLTLAAFHFKNFRPKARRERFVPRSKSLNECQSDAVISNLVVDEDVHSIQNLVHSQKYSHKLHLS